MSLVNQSARNSKIERQKSNLIEKESLKSMKIVKTNPSKTVMEPSSIFWATFFKEQHQHHNISIISAFIDLILKEIQQEQHKDEKDMLFEDQMLIPELMDKLEQIKLQNILLAIRRALQCERCSNEIGKTIKNQYKTFIQWFCLFQDRNMISFEIYSLYYDIMDKIYTMYVLNVKNYHVWNTIEEETLRIHHRESNKLDKCPIRLLLIILLIQIAKKYAKNGNKKALDRFFRIYNQNNENNGLSKFLVELITKKKLTIILGEYFYDTITTQLINFVKCQSYYNNKKHQIISCLRMPAKEIKTDHQPSDKKQDFTSNNDSNQVISLPKTQSLQQFSESKQIAPILQKQLLPLSFREQLQIALTSLQSSTTKVMTDPILYQNLCFLSTLRINFKIKCRDERIYILKRLINLSQHYPSLVKSSIQNSLSILQISQFIDIINETLRFCCEDSRQAYRQNLKQNLKACLGIIKQIHLDL